MAVARTASPTSRSDQSAIRGYRLAASALAAREMGPHLGARTVPDARRSDPLNTKVQGHSRQIARAVMPLAAGFAAIYP